MRVGSKEYNYPKAFRDDEGVWWPPAHLTNLQWELHASRQEERDRLAAQKS